MHPKVVCIGADGLGVKYVKSNLEHLPTFYRLFRMGTGGALTGNGRGDTCSCWLDFLLHQPPDIRGKGGRKKSGGKRARRKTVEAGPIPVWHTLTEAGVSVSAVNMPLPTEPRDINGVLEPRDCPILARPACSKPEDVLMLAEENLRNMINVCRSEGCDVMMFGLQAVDLIGRGPRSERDTFLVAHKAVDSIIGRIINALEPASTIVFSPFTTKRRTRSRPGGVDSAPSLWVAIGEDIPSNREETAHISEIAPLLMSLAGLPAPAPDDERGAGLMSRIACDLAAAQV